MSEEGKFKVKAKGKAKSDVQGFAKAFRALRTLARQSKGSSSGKSGRSARAARGAPVPKAGGSLQRCSVRLTYSANKGDGQWAAHGKYIARESAALEAEQEQELTPESLQADQDIEAAPGIAPGESQDINPPEEPPHERTERHPGYGQPADRLRVGRVAALHQPYLSQYQRQGPTRTLNSVRGLSSLGVVRFGGRAEGLLPGDAPGHLEQRRPERPDPLRRPGDGRAGTPAESGKQRVKGARGFGSAGDAMPIAETLAEWQKAKDEHLFKLIISPEFGERMNLQAHTKQLVAQMEKDLGTRLEWVAVEHFNTEHPHVHLAVRGRDDQGKSLRIGKEYVKRGLRDRAQQIATNQLGYRTPEDMRLAAERQVVQQRFTDIDRALQKKATNVGQAHQLDYSGGIPKSPAIREARLREIRRLQQLVAMGIAKKTGPMTWQVDKSFETALRQIQVANDRLKSLHEQRATLSDPRLPLVATDTRNIRRLSGRVIGTGLDENKGIPYLLLEGTDAKVHYLYHDQAIDQARRAGQLQPGAFIELERRFVAGEDGRKRAQTVVTDKGPAEALLTDQKHLAREALHSAVRQPELPKPGNYGGWLGRYHQAVATRAQQLVSQGQLKPGPNGYEYQAARAKSRSRS